jgi:predicted Zn-dependent protease
MTVSGCAGRHGTRRSRRLWAAPAWLWAAPAWLWAAPAWLCLSFALAGCGDIGRFQTAVTSPTTPGPIIKPNRAVVTQTPAAEREHERILSSYGGAYDDPQLEALIGKTVDRLVAASDRPDQAYKVTILNSGAVNAFALPNCPRC